MKKDPIHIKFHNQQNPNIGFDLIRIEDIYHRKDLDHSPYDIHLVEFYILLFMEDGKGAHTIDFTDYSCTKGTVLTIRKDQIQKFCRSESLRGYMLLFTDDFLVSYLEELEAQKSIQLFNELLGSPKIQLSKTEFAEMAELIVRIKNEYFKINDQYSSGIIRSELHILIAKLYRIKSKKEKTRLNKKYLNDFIKLQSLVEENVGRTRKVLDYARMMGISSKTINNITQSIVNKTAKEFVDELCTKQIKRLLINTQLSVKEIAYASGFEESTNFYKYFKHQTGSTPENYRLSS